jgi:hypothetical protein
MGKKGSEDEIEIVSFRTLQMVDILGEETDRGCVLVAASYIEHSLKTALESRLGYLASAFGENATEKEIGQLLKDYESQFYSFKSCIRLSRLVGIIRIATKDSLSKFADLRNGFAHHEGRKQITQKWIDLFTKTDERIFKQIQTLAEMLPVHSQKIGNMTIARRRFMSWAAIVDGMLSFRAGSGFEKGTRSDLLGKWTQSHS